MIHEDGWGISIKFHCFEPVRTWDWRKIHDKSLQQINLSRNKITDAGLITLAENGDKFKSLQRINVSYN